MLRKTPFAPSFGPKDVGALKERLKRLRTREGEECVAVQWSPKPEEVRLGMKDLARKTGFERLSLQELLALILKRAQEERDDPRGTEEACPYEVAFRGWLRNLKDLSEEKNERLGKVLERMEETAMREIRAVTEKDFLRFVLDVGMDRFEDRLDRLIAKDSAPKDQNYRERLARYLEEEMQGILKETQEKVEEAKTSLQKVMDELPKPRENPPPLVHKQPGSINLQSKVDFPKTERATAVCWGPGGVARRPGTNEFLAIDEEGYMVMFDGIKGGPRKEVKVDVNMGSLFNCVEFSPDGSLFLVGTSYKKSCLSSRGGRLQKKEEVDQGEVWKH
jgi:hypothetical protein